MSGDEQVVENVLHALYADRGVSSWGSLWTMCRDWPPDAFAIAYILVTHHAIYRTAVSTDEISGFEDETAIDDVRKELWPNKSLYIAHVTQLGLQWRLYAEAKLTGRSATVAPPTELQTLFDLVERSIPKLLACPRQYKGATRSDLTTLFCLIAAADEACIGLGLPGPAVNGTLWFSLSAELRLVDSNHGSLARFSNHLVRVLPKSHTPQRGLTPRSLSHHVCAITHDFGVEWMRGPTVSSLDERLNLLLLPWPLEITDKAFAPPENNADENLPNGWGYFDFAPKVHLDVKRACELVELARAGGRSVDGVILPEAAVTVDEADALADALAEIGIQLALVGVRGPRYNASYLRTVPGRTYRQGKHHRWCLDRRQIEQYGLQRSLNPYVNWWENIRLEPRKLGFLTISNVLTVCHVICEDLARLDPVDQIIRSVGPTLLIALLQDGPQLRQRWGGRYASVYSDDPGTSVLTLTSLGMALASKPRDGASPRRCIGLWSDPDTGTTELDLALGAEGLWISLCAHRGVEYTADGRTDGGKAARLILVDHQSIGG